MLGGLGVGVMAFFLPQVLGMGYGWVQLAMDGHLPLTLILIVVFREDRGDEPDDQFRWQWRCVRALDGHRRLGGRGVWHRWPALFPGVVTQPAAFALVGMAGFFAGVAKTPVRR